MQHAEFKFEIATYHCPIINPPSQRHMFTNKLHNIQLAIDRMQNMILLPSDEFSFWQYALAPVKKNGYREGAMFVNHKVTSSIGGGLCQLSGVIYNLALLAGCKIIERFNHSIDAYGENRYIPLGQDATVAYEHKDLRFSNNHTSPIKLILNVDQDYASGSIWSPSPLSRKISVETQWIKRIPSPVQRRPRRLPPELRHEDLIHQGLEGKVVEASRIFKSENGHVEHEFLSRDHYRATPTRIFYHTSNPIHWLQYLSRK